MSKKQKNEEEEISVDAVEPEAPIIPLIEPLVMLITELEKLTPEEKEKFRRAGGTTTQH